MSSGKQKRGRRRKTAGAQVQITTYLDNLHREDSSQARKWNQPARQQYRPQQYRRQPQEPPPEVPRARDGYQKVTPSSIEKVQGSDGQWHYYVTDVEGNVKEIEIVRDS